MRTAINAEQIDRYRNDGFLVIEDFLEAGELDTLREAVDRAVAELGKNKVAGDSSWVEGDSYYDLVFTQRLNLWKISNVIRSFVTAPALGRMLVELAGVDGLRVWHDQALIKQPFANPTSWHLDNPYWSFYSRSAISIWIALDDATPHNGCLYFIPGSHLQTSYENSPIGENMGDLFRLYPQLKDSDPVAAPMRAGSASVHNGLTAHAAGANMTRWPRRAMTCAYMPEGSKFNGQRNVLPPAYCEELEVGDALDRDEHLPRVFP